IRAGVCRDTGGGLTTGIGSAKHQMRELIKKGCPRAAPEGRAGHPVPARWARAKFSRARSLPLQSETLVPRDFQEPIRHVGLKSPAIGIQLEDFMVFVIGLARDGVTSFPTL